jgi:hypothetical protein
MGRFSSFRQRRSVWVIVGCVVLGSVSSLSAGDPFAQPQADGGSGAAEAGDANRVALRTRWVSLVKPPPPGFEAEGVSYDRAEFFALLDGFSRAGLAMVGPISSHRATPTRPVKLTFTGLKVEAGEPVNSVRITVGGVEQEFTARNVGVDVSLKPAGQSRAGEQATLHAVVKRTRFLGFREYGADASGPPVPKGFFQPIFETDERELSLELAPGRVAMVQVDMRPPERERRGVLDWDSLPPISKPTPRPEALVWLVVELEPAAEAPRR